MTKELALCKNAVVAYLKKAPAEFSKADIVDFVANNISKPFSLSASVWTVLRCSPL